MLPERGGRTRIVVETPCRAKQFVIFGYADTVFIMTLDGRGSGQFVLDCFAGEAESVVISFEDDTKVVRRPATLDLRDVSKVAIVWTSPVDLDLHAFEYAAATGGPGHVSTGRANSFDQASADGRRDGRGHGFFSTSGTGVETGMNFEVYTFVHQPGQATGSVTFAVDYKTRGTRPTGQFCGSGALSEVPFKAYITERGKPPRQFDLAFAPLPCGTDLSTRARFNSRLIPELAIRG